MAGQAELFVKSPGTGDLPPALLFVGGKLRVDGRAEADAQRRITDTLGRLLQVKNLAVLLGAGASMHLGSPSIRHLSRAELRALLQRANMKVSTDVDQAIDDLAESDDADLEKLLSTLSAGIAYASMTGAPALQLLKRATSIQSLIGARKLINRALTVTCQLPDLNQTDKQYRTDPLASHRQFFRRLLRARRGDLPRIRLFTTNYDTLIEQTLDQVGTTYIDGFTGTVTRVFRPEVYEQDIYVQAQTSDRTMSRLPEVIYLHKLHGSINWRSNEQPALGATTVVQTPGPIGDDDHLALIYPTPQKEADVLGYPYSELFRTLAGIVSSPETILLVVGYGFGDEHINRFVFQALASIPTLQLFVVDPFAARVQGEVNGSQPTPSEPEPAGANETQIVLADTVAGRLAKLDDARVSVLAGEVARFVEFASHGLPDPDEVSAGESSADELVARLAAAFGGPDAAKPS